jgi:hypothetical protein
MLVSLYKFVFLTLLSGEKMDSSGSGDGGLDAQVDSALGSRESSQQRSEGEVAGAGGVGADTRTPDPSHEPCQVNVKIADLGNACWTVMTSNIYCKCLICRIHFQKRSKVEVIRTGIYEWISNQG